MVVVNTVPCLRQQALRPLLTRQVSGPTGLPGPSHSEPWASPYQSKIPRYLPSTSQQQRQPQAQSQVGYSPPLQPQDSFNQGNSERSFTVSGINSPAEPPDSPYNISAFSKTGPAGVGVSPSPQRSLAPPQSSASFVSSVATPAPRGGATLMESTPTRGVTASSASNLAGYVKSSLEPLQQNESADSSPVLVSTSIGIPPPLGVSNHQSLGAHFFPLPLTPSCGSCCHYPLRCARAATCLTSRDRTTSSKSTV